MTPATARSRRVGGLVGGVRPVVTAEAAGVAVVEVAVVVGGTGGAGVGEGAVSMAGVGAAAEAGLGGAGVSEVSWVCGCRWRRFGGAEAVGGMGTGAIAFDGAVPRTVEGEDVAAAWAGLLDGSAAEVEGGEGMRLGRRGDDGPEEGSGMRREELGREGGEGAGGSWERVVGERGRAGAQKGQGR